MIDDYVAKLRERVEALIEWALILERAKEYISGQWKAEFPYTCIRIVLERKGVRSAHLSYLKFRFYPLRKKEAEQKRRPKFSKFLGPVLTRKGARKARSERFWVRQRPVVKVFNGLCGRLRKAHRVIWGRLKRITRAGKFTSKEYCDTLFGLRQIDKLFEAQVRDARRVTPPASQSSVGGAQP